MLLCCSSPVCWVEDKFLGRIFEFVSDSCLSDIFDLGPFWCYWLSSGRFQHNEDVSTSFPYPHIGQVWSFYFLQDQVCFACIFSTRSLQKKKKLLSCVSWPQGWAFGTTFPRALVSAEFSTCSCLPWTKITSPKPMWHSWILLKLWVGAEQGIKSTQSPAVSRSESPCICTSVCNSLKRICLLQVRMQWNSIEYCLRGDYCHGDVGVTLFKVLVEPALGFTHIDWWEGNQGRETGEAGSWQQAWGDSGGDYNRTSSRWVPQQRSDWGWVEWQCHLILSGEIGKGLYFLPLCIYPYSEKW